MTFCCCLTFLHLVNDATSIPAQCCAMPYIVNGRLYYNCTVNTALSNEFGCYNGNGQWVTCQQPDGASYLCCYRVYNATTNRVTIYTSRFPGCVFFLGLIVWAFGDFLKSGLPEFCK